MAKTAQLFTIRSSDGGCLATYRRYTAAQAIQAFKDDQAAYYSTFRTGTPPDFSGITAVVEPPFEWV